MEVVVFSVEAECLLVDGDIVMNKIGLGLYYDLKGWWISESC